MEAIDSLNPYAQCDRDDAATIIGLQQAEAAAEAQAVNEVNFYIDEYTGELITLCRFHAEQVHGLRLICQAQDGDYCGECDVEKQWS